MSQQTLKELLKPPFSFGTPKYTRGPLFDANGQYLIEMIPAPIGPFDPDHKVFDTFGEFLTAALNEKWARDLGERKQWQKHTLLNPASQKNHSWYDCPYCGQLAGENGLTNYCPNCGKPLDPPEETKNER